MKFVGKDGTVAGRTIDRADARARAAVDEAGTSVLRAGRVPLTGSNRKRRAEQAGRGFLAPCRRGGRASTAVDEQVVQDDVAEVEAVAVAGEEVAVAEEQVPRVEERVAVVEEEVVEEWVVHDTDTTPGASTEPSVYTDGAFPGGPFDKSVLTGYADHVAYRIWHGEERPVLKLTSHGSKLKNFPERPMLEQVARIVRDFHLMDFAGCSLTMLDVPILSAFVERWHPETSSFHLPFREMTVTLDDVHSLFHIPIVGTFFTPVHRDQTMAVHMVMDALEVDELVVLKEFGDTRGFHLKMSWLRRVYQELVDAGRYQAAAMAYMLHLVACTLFADKSGVYIDVSYLSLFINLETPCWAWGVAAMTMLYTTLDVASCLDTRQLAGYLSLLQCWIYEQFPHSCERNTQRCAAADPYARRWKAGQTHHGGVIEYRRRLDALTLYDVIWTPYTGHCDHLPFDVSSLYSGYVIWESHVARHLLERCLRQFGYIQGIPRPVPETLAGGIDRWIQSHILSSLEIIDTTIAVQ
ncbi:protein MAIN-LIKE 1-like [Vicia villosa]|uniref:protein MAIN-LIKE 1-like n=1 Tax=Vicia villosa TaxID=3911 RepID=UPI00273BBF63|nr:protein MAIN-LIKE 1-like [Vicia villosa]